MKKYHLEINVFTVVRICLGLVFVYLLGGCGSLTGIPGHGGGKRFAVEQELIAATTRATIKQIDLTSIKGRKVNLFVNAIGDTGNGNLIGGRFSVVSQLRGDYIHSPPVKESLVYPKYTTKTSSSSSSKGKTSQKSSETATQGDETSTGLATNTTASSSSSSETSTTESLLAAPSKKITQQKGNGSEVQVGLEYKGLGSYQNSEEISSDDLQYLSGLLQTYFFLKGVYVAPPSEAEIDVYVIVDVFGTVRTRVDWFIANNEILRAKTALEVIAVDHQTGVMIMSPQAVISEAEYNEQYILWAGPVVIKKYLKASDPLLCDFSDLQPEKSNTVSHELNETIPYPFRHQIEKWVKENGMKADGVTLDFVENASEE